MSFFGMGAPMERWLVRAEIVESVIAGDTRFGVGSVRSA